MTTWLSCHLDLEVGDRSRVFHSKTTGFGLWLASVESAFYAVYDNSLVSCKVTIFLLFLDFEYQELGVILKKMCSFVR